MTDIEKEVYKWRLSEGEIVYFVEPDNVLGKFQPDSQLIVKKASVGLIRENYRYQPVVMWTDVNQDPKGMGTVAMQSPRQLFTAEEIQGITEDIKELRGKPVDELIQDSIGGKRLANTLFGAVLDRMGDDINRPFDPEY
ncbi:MAG: hypothetical protein Q7R49_05590 [Candidatus Daviesbacteria bacterium]|nr:hypothetical protein [Candidatus Daviesbacteria bacterium]